VKIIEDGDGIMLSLSVDPQVLKKSCPIVSSDQLALPFSFDAKVAYDFHEKKRESNNMPGAFTRMQPGTNEIVIYEFSPLYQKRLCSLINRIGLNAIF
jgi:hypothetical protein